MLTVQQAATALQMHPESVRRMARQGRLPASKVGNGRNAQWRILPETVAAIVGAERVPRDEQAGDAKEDGR